MTSTVHEFGSYGDTRAALADPNLVPPPAESGPPGSMAWLRATVARFSTGEPHARRRALVEADLGRLDPSALRRAVASGPDDEPRRLVVRTLAQAFGLPASEAVAQAVTDIGAAYFEGDDGEADAALAWLLPQVLALQAEVEVDRAEPATSPGRGRGQAQAQGRETEERLELAANRIGLLVQACDATGRLIENAQRAIQDQEYPASHTVEALLVETLRHDTPVRTMRRVAARSTCVAGVEIAAGDLVVLDIAAANRDPEAMVVGIPLAFGSPPRLCPGRDQALALAAGILDRTPADEAPATEDALATADGPATDGPATDDRDPVALIEALVRHVLVLAGTWTAWDGHPVPIDDRLYTPHKAIRRVADHLVDHLAELEARLAGEEPQPDRWHASATTTQADLAPFTQDDLDEADSRLTRLARIWANRLGALTPDQLDHSPGDGWTFRQLAFHLAGSVYYADAVGDLNPGRSESTT